LSYDIFYIKNSSITLDLLIFLQTIEVVVWGKAISMAGAPRHEPADKKYAHKRSGTDGQASLVNRHQAQEYPEAAGATSDNFDDAQETELLARQSIPAESQS
jgi:hypothetical protein